MKLISRFRNLMFTRIFKLLNKLFQQVWLFAVAILEKWKDVNQWINNGPNENSLETQSECDAIYYNRLLVSARIEIFLRRLAIPNIMQA